MKRVCVLFSVKELEKLLKLKKNCRIIRVEQTAENHFGDEVCIYVIGEGLRDKYKTEQGMMSLRVKKDDFIK